MYEKHRWKNVNKNKLRLKISAKDIPSKLRIMFLRSGNIVKLKTKTGGDFLKM